MSKRGFHLVPIIAVGWVVCLLMVESAHAQLGLNPIQQLAQIQALQAAQAVPIQLGPGGQPITPALLIITGRHDAATTQPSTQPAPEVQALVDQLADDSFAKRQAAIDALSHMGQPIEPQLRGALEQHVTPEAANSLQTLIKQLNQGGEYGPSVITIHAKDSPLRKVLEEFATQSDVNIVVRTDAAVTQVNQSTVTIDLDHATFWDALRQIESTCSTSLTIGANQINFGQVPGQPLASSITDAPGTTVGPCFIQPAVATLNRNLTYGAAQSQVTGMVSLRLTVNCEPKITVVNNQMICDGFQNLDDRGHTLQTLNGVAQTYGSVAGHATWNLIDTFREVPDMGTHLKSLKTNLTLSLQTGRKVVDIPDLIHAASQTRDLDGGTLLVKNVTVANGQCHIDLTYTSPFNPTATGTTIANNPAGLAEFLDDSGRQLNAGNMPISRNINNNISTWTWTATIPAAQGTPTTLRYELTTNSRQMEVPIELHDLELPISPTTTPS